MSRKSKGAERQAEREDAELKARIAALDARVEAQQTEHRNQLAQVRLEREAQELQAYAAQRIAAASAGGDIAPAFMRMLREGQYTSHAAIDAAISAAREGTAEMRATQAPASLPLAEQPRDTQGRWVPQQPIVPEPQEIDPSTLSLADYMALRGELGMDGRGIDNLGRAPGRERTEFMGHQLEDGSGFADWRDYIQNKQVFSSQLPDNRSVPPGYARRSAEQGEEWR
jgi:hypothetical protein